MFIFGGPDSKRGCFMEKIINGEASAGAVLNVAGTEYPQTHEPFFVTNVSFAQKERFSVVQCFNDTNYVYAFGHDPMSSTLSVRFVMFLAGNKSTPGDGVLDSVMELYTKGRLSTNLTRSTLSIGSTVLKGFIVGMESSTMSPEFNLQSFDATILLAESYKKG